MTHLRLAGALLVAIVLARAPAAAAPSEASDPVKAIAQKLRTHSRTIAELKKAAEQAEELMKTIRDVNTIMRPMIPALKKIGDSKALRSLGDVPYVGNAAKAVQTSAVILEALGQALVALEEQDRRTSQKLRQAVFASDRFMRTESLEDLAALVTAYDEAIPVLEETIRSYKRTLAQIDAANRTLARIATLRPVLQRQNAELAKSIDELRGALKELRRAIVLGTAGLTATVAFMRDISRQGREVLGR